MSIFPVATMMAVLLTAGTAAAQGRVDPVPAGTIKEKKVCRSETDTGSIIPKRTCHTQAEWNTIDSANADAARQVMSHHGAAAAQPR